MPRPVASSANDVTEPGEDLPLAVEDLDLRLHHPGSTGQGDELDVGCDEVLGRRRLRHGGQLLGCLGSFQLMPFGLSPGLRDEHVDLGQLAVDGGELAGEACGQVTEGIGRGAGL